MADDANKSVIPDYETLVAQLQSIGDEVARLAGVASQAAGARGSALVTEVGKDIGAAQHYVSRKGHAVDARIEHAVSANPYIALGLAAGLGLLMGMMAHRK